MATRKASVELHTGLHRFPSVLAYAVFEWLLIFLLFLDALFSYIITKFASSAKLQPPCLLCSRLDHILGSAKPGFYEELICHTHRLKIASLFYCHTHGKLYDVHGMCESCLLSFAAENKSNSETYRLLVGRLGSDLECHVEEDHKISNCDEPFKSKSCLHGLLQTRSIGTDGFGNEIKRASPLPATNFRIGNHGFEPLSHIGYTQLNITSDSESEIPVSDEEYGTGHGHGETDDSKEALLSKSFLESGGVEVKILPEIPLVDINLENPNLEATEKVDPLATFDRISGDGVSSSTKILDALVDESEDKCVTEICKTDKCGGDMAQNCISVNREIEVPENDLIPNESGLKMNEIIDQPSSSMPKSMDLNDAYILAVGNKGSQQSDIFAQLIGKASIGKESTKIHEDLKLLLSQLSASRGIDLPLIEMGAGMHRNGDDFKVSDAPSPIGLQILNKRFSIERNLSGVSMDGSIVSEIEGENVLDRLKRQIEFDRKNMGALYKELEEERSASTIAATQAMAMITRLQEEKAAMQMEALQYQRMMEEQAEYDQEALQQANELLAQREKDLQGMEAELESYRKRFQQELEIDERMMPDNHTNFSSSSPIFEKDKDSCLSHSLRFQEESIKNEAHILEKDLMLDFEDEKLYISERLKNLEKKLHLFTNNGIHVAFCKLNGNRGDYLPDKNSEDTALCEFPLNHGHDQIFLEENATGNGGSGRGPSAKTNRFLPSTGGSQFGDEQNHDRDWKYSSRVGREIDMVSIENEVSDLNERLQALESDRGFIEHSINSLRNGNEGVQFIQEIACHLRELRRIGIGRTEQTVA